MDELLIETYVCVTRILITLNPCVDFNVRNCHYFRSLITLGYTVATLLPPKKKKKPQTQTRSSP